MEYNKILSQRNSLLKYFALNNTYNANTLQIYNEQLVERTNNINKRKFMDSFIPALVKYTKLLVKEMKVFHYPILVN